VHGDAVFRKHKGTFHDPQGYYLIRKDKRPGEFRTHHLPLKEKNTCKKHDFSFYTNADVTEGNIMELAELYRTRWGIENGYLEKKDTGEKTHSPDMHVRRFLFLFSVLLYNLWILLNMFRGINRQGHIILMDFLMAMRKGGLRAMLNDNG
jgi:IS4 transposase